MCRSALHMPSMQGLFIGHLRWFPQTVLKLPHQSRRTVLGRASHLGPAPGIFVSHCWLPLLTAPCRRFGNPCDAGPKRPERRTPLKAVEFITGITGRTPSHSTCDSQKIRTTALHTLVNCRVGRVEKRFSCLRFLVRPVLLLVEPESVMRDRLGRSIAGLSTRSGLGDATETLVPGASPNWR